MHKLRCLNYSLNHTRCFYQLAGTTRSATQSKPMTLVDVAFSFIVMFDFQLERWLDIKRECCTLKACSDLFLLRCLALTSPAATATRRLPRQTRRSMRPILHAIAGV